MLCLAKLELNSGRKVLAEFRIYDKKNIFLFRKKLVGGDFGLNIARSDAALQLPYQLDDGSMDFGILHCGLWRRRRREIGSTE